MKRFLIVLISLNIVHFSFADEGMWLPLLLEKYNYTDMKENGLEIEAKDIYSEANKSLKDAVVIFDKGCTGSIISDKGLLITNHHCGYDNIQAHSTIDKNYLETGFWAMSNEQELPNPGLTVSFIKKIENVTEKILSGIQQTENDETKDSIINSNINRLKSEIQTSPFISAEIKPLFYGNDYYLFVYEVYKDVRLVGAPPSSIGKFGGDTDNWIWPRHTGDFSLFRVYADSNNNPAEYSPNNIPYKPVKSLEVSIQQLHENDFTFIYGFPGKTEQFLHSTAINLMINKYLPHKIAIRKIKMDIQKAAMNRNQGIAIQYAGKNADLSNALKKWEGIVTGLSKVNAVKIKKEKEQDFINHINTNDSLNAKYGNILNDLDSLHTLLDQFNFTIDYMTEIFFNNEIIEFINRNHPLIKAIQSKNDSISEISRLELSKNAILFFKNYNFNIDKTILSKLIPVYKNNIPSEYLPDFYSDMQKKYRSNNSEYIDHLYKETVFRDSLNFFRSLEKGLTDLDKDPFYELVLSISRVYYSQIIDSYKRISDELDKKYKVYIKALSEVYPERLLYPDANYTPRVAYGHIKGYCPFDAVCYSYYSSLKGVVEKSLENNPDYKVPTRLIELYEKEEFGKYSNKDTMQIAFIANNHTSGGNSGSPVFNSKGQLIGLNFDRCWEGTMSDYYYDLSFCRNISVDIKYVLFIIDKFAGAGYLIEEMHTIIQPPN